MGSIDYKRIGPPPIAPTQNQRTMLRRKRMRQNGGSHTEEEWETLKRKYDYLCLCCGGSGLYLERDHIIPVAKGGRSSIDNIQPLCSRCNQGKSGRIIDYRYEAREE